MLAGVACGATPVTILDGGRSNTAAVMAIGWTACTSLPGRLETEMRESQKSVSALHATSPRREQQRCCEETGVVPVDTRGH
jgi:starvation-inducible outer membrane lipoprotein